MMGFGYGIGGFGGLGSLLFIALMVVGIVYLVRALDLGRPAGRARDATNVAPRASDGEDSALRILRERYARGEIDRDEFDERRRALS